MNRKALGTSGYVVLGLALQHGEITPYELKQRIATSVGYFWAYSHPQIYVVSEKLRKAGLLSQRRERSGRRRKMYRITAAGEQVFKGWLSDPIIGHTELRDLAMLKLYFGEFSDQGTICAMARQQVAAHEARLVEYQRIPDQRQLNSFALRTVELGIEFEKMAREYWRIIERDNI